MWNNYTLVAELLGSFVLVFGVLATIKASSAKTFSLQGAAKNIFVALGVALSLMAAVYVAGMDLSFIAKNADATDHTHGWANPAVALMASIGSNNFHDFLPAIVGEFIGGIAAVLVMFGANKLMNCEKHSAPVAEFKAKDSFFGEIPGSIIFLGGVAIAVFAHNAPGLSGIIVGLSIFAALILVGWRFALLLNPMVGAVLLLNDVLNKQFALANIKNYSLSLVANLGTAAVIGAVYFGLSHM